MFQRSARITRAPIMPLTILLKIVLLFNTLGVSLPFTLMPSRHASVSKLQARSTRICENLLDVSNLKDCNIELWLDLRDQSSVSPSAALEHLNNDVWETYFSPNAERPLMVDKVLTSQHENLCSMVNSMRHEYEAEVGLMIHEEDSIHEIINGIMLPCGKVVNVELGKDGISNLNADPMPVLETVSKGEWVVLEANDDVEEESLSSLVQVVTDGVDAFGVLEGTSGNNESTVSSGGIGLSCPSQASVMETGALISSLVDRKKFEITDSGIIVQSQVSNENDGTTYAIIMPFDSLLWKTSSLFLLQ